MASVARHTQYVSEITDEMVENNRQIAIHSEEHGKEESEKCKASPYYFYTHYFMVNGKPATTRLTEEEFNKQYSQSLKQ